jgi:hypothetical protein
MRRGTKRNQNLDFLEKNIRCPMLPLFAAAARSGNTASGALWQGMHSCHFLPLENAKHGKKWQLVAANCSDIYEHNDLLMH